jgi:hypothetical protein
MLAAKSYTRTFSESSRTVPFQLPPRRALVDGVAIRIYVLTLIDFHLNKASQLWA